MGAPPALSIARFAALARLYSLMGIRTTVSALIVSALLAAVVQAEPRFAVTLRSGFVMQADRTEAREGQLALILDGGEILLATHDVHRIDELPAPAQVVQHPAHPAPAQQSGQQPTPSVSELIRAAAAKNGLPEAFVRSVAQAESALRPDAVSPKGALGVMQLMPGTAAALGVDPHDLASNIEGGARLLRTLLLQYQHQPDQVRLALAAYNAGAGSVQKHNGVPPYRETQVYVERVLRRYHAGMPAAATPQPNHAPR
ncbi:MAG: lytic transglycosylase domain-containing protein [Bryobacterales bacterium]|nr:lytic transglycosylase domain-containing protein [Bryobacterales bacterium]